MPDVTALSSGFNDGYHYRLESGYNETSALAARNATAASADNQTGTILLAAHGQIFSNTYNWRSWVAFDMSGNDDGGSSISGNNVTSANLVLQAYANLVGFVNYTAETDEKIILVKATASTNFDGLDKYNDIDGWVSSGTYDGNVTKYGEATQISGGGAMSFTLNSTAITDINSAISSGGTVKMGSLTEDDYLSRTGTGDALGEAPSGNKQLGMRFKSVNDTTSTNRPKLELTYGAADSPIPFSPTLGIKGGSFTIKGGKFTIK